MSERRSAVSRDKKRRKPVKGYRGEPWSTDGRHIYDRDGHPFAEVYPGCEEFARTIVACVNLLTNLPLRKGDFPPRTEFEKHALAILRHEARLRGDDPR